MYTLRRSYKIYNFTVAVSPLYLVVFKRTVVGNLPSKSASVHLCPFLSQNSFIILLEDNVLDSHRLLVTILSSKLNIT